MATPKDLPPEFLNNQPRKQGRDDNGHSRRDPKENDQMAAYKAALARRQEISAKAVSTRQRNQANAQASSTQTVPTAVLQGVPAGMGAPISVAHSPLPEVAHAETVGLASMPQTPQASVNNYSLAEMLALYQMGWQQSRVPRTYSELLTNTNFDDPGLTDMSSSDFSSPTPMTLFDSTQMREFTGSDMLNTPMATMSPAPALIPIEPLHLFKQTELPASGMQGDVVDDEVEPVAEVSHGVVDMDRENSASPQDKDADKGSEEEDNIAECGSGLQVTTRAVQMKAKLTKGGLKKEKKRKRSRNVAAGDEQSANEGDSQAKGKRKKSRSIQDLPLDSKAILGTAFDCYKMELTKNNPFPDYVGAAKTADAQQALLQEAMTMAMDAWITACFMKNVEGKEPTEVEVKRIHERMPQFRGQLKDKAAELAVKTYGLVDPISLTSPTPEAIEAVKEKNRSIVEEYQKNKFFYKDPNNKDLPDSLFRAPIIQQVFNYTWFGSGTFRRSWYFAGETAVPLVTIAFILSAVDCIMDSWSTGTPVTIKYSADTYAPRYNAHLARLQKWQDFSAKQEEDLSLKVRQDLLHNARAAAGVSEGVTVEEAETSDEEMMLSVFKGNQGSAI